jgi:hypothetical protein
MKAKVLIVLCLLALVSGCMTTSYNPQTKEIKYSRLGDMDAANIAITMDPNGVINIEVAKIKNTGFESLIEMIKDAYEAGKRVGAGGL